MNKVAPNSRVEPRVAIIDPSIFTPPYDQALAEALSVEGIDVTWLGRWPRADDAVSTHLIQPLPIFYRSSERVRHWLPSSLLLPFKALEHSVQSFGLVKYLVKNRFSVAHFQWTPVPFIDQYSIRRIQRKMPVILTVHDTEVFHGNASHPIQRRGWSRVLRAADHVIVHVETAVSKLTDEGVRSDRIHVIGHPAFASPGKNEIEAARKKYSRADLGFADDRVNFLLFGRLAPYKGLEVVLKAVECMTEEERSRIRVVFAGKSAFDHDDFSNRINKLGLQDTFRINPSFLQEDELVSYLSWAEVLLFPYTDIDASGALMQVLPFCPSVVASDIGMFSELFEHMENAFLVRPNSASDLAQAMNQLASDANLRAKFSTRVRALVEDDLSWAKAAKATIGVYETALAR